LWRTVKLLTVREGSLAPSHGGFPGDGRTSGSQKLAAVCGGMAHVVTFDHVDDVLRDIGGVIGDSFQILGDKDQLKRLKDYGGIAHHVAQQLAKNLIAECIDLVIESETRRAQCQRAA